MKMKIILISIINLVFVSSYAFADVIDDDTTAVDFTGMQGILSTTIQGMLYIALIMLVGAIIREVIESW